MKCVDLSFSKPQKARFIPSHSVPLHLRTTSLSHTIVIVQILTNLAKDKANHQRMLVDEEVLKILTKHIFQELASRKAARAIPKASMFSDVTGKQSKLLRASELNLARSRELGMNIEIVRKLVLMVLLFSEVRTQLALKTSTDTMHE